jgi:CheY-like chemotaxis protein
VGLGLQQKIWRKKTGLSAMSWKFSCPTSKRNKSLNHFKEKAMTKQCVLVDDVEVSRYATALIFEDLGFEVSEADGAQSCLEVLKTVHPDIILIDLHLRKESGLDLINKIKVSTNYTTVPVLVYSGVEKEANQEDIIKAGAIGFLPKPATKEQVLTVLKAHHII